MPTAGGFDHISGFNHPTDADFLALEDIVYGFTRRTHEDDSDDDDSEEGNPWLQCRQNSSLKCPTCKKDHVHAAPANDKVPEENRYSHDARVVYASFCCPICLEDPAGPPMVVLPCGHAICQDDFRLLGGKTTNAEADAQVRQAANEETEQHRESISRNQPPLLSRRIPPFLRSGREDMDHITMSMMHAFASSLNEAMESTSNGNSGSNNNDDDEEDEESTDSEMPELIRPPVNFDSSDDDPPRIRAPRDSSDDDDDVPELLTPQRLHLNPFSHPARFFRPTDLFPRFPSIPFGGRSARRPQSTDTGSDDDDDDSSYFEHDDDDTNDYDDDNEDSEYEDPEEVLWRLSEYHPGNAVLSDPPTHPGFPRLGQWLLVPEVADHNKVNLMYYCEYEEENNLFVAKQFPRGTRMIANGKHGVYVHTPPRHFYRNGGRRQWPRNNNQWEVYYVKNSKPETNRSSRRRGRQESAQVLSTTVSDPVFRYKLPKSAQMVADGKGGIWALCRVSSLPQDLLSQIEPSEDDSNDNDSRRRNNQRNRRYRLVHYSSRQNNRRGVVVGGVFPSTCKLFMDQSGGVILLQPNMDPALPSSGTPFFRSLWHISDQANHPQTLLYGGLPRDTKVVGDSSGSSVFLLSSGGRLQSILTRVMVEHSDPSTATGDDTPAVRTTTCFSYDLDIAIEGIQDIVDVAEGDMKQIFLHARMSNLDATNTSQRFRWRLCQVMPRTETAGERDVNVVDLDVDCPRTCRIVSDRERGVWVWKKPSYHINAGDRCFLHVHASSDGQDEWNSPCVFPPRTHLAALG